MLEQTAKYSISEVVERLRREGFIVEAHRLRNYEKEGLVKPSRTSNPNQEQRRYSELDIMQIRRILFFIFVGVSLKTTRSRHDKARIFLTII